MPPSHPRFACAERAVGPEAGRIRRACSTGGDRSFTTATFASEADLLANSRELRSSLSSAELVIVLAVPAMELESLRARVRDLAMIARGRDVPTVGSVVAAIVDHDLGFEPSLQLVITGGAGFAGRVASAHTSVETEVAGALLGDALSGSIIDVSGVDRRGVLLLMGPTGSTADRLTESARSVAADGMGIVTAETMGVDYTAPRFIDQQVAGLGPVGLAIETTGDIAAGVEHGWLDRSGPLVGSSPAARTVRWPNSLGGTEPLGLLVVGRFVRRGAAGGSAGIDEAAALLAAIPAAMPVGGFLTHGDVIRSSARSGRHDHSLVVLAFT